MASPLRVKSARFYSDRKSPLCARKRTSGTTLPDQLYIAPAQSGETIACSSANVPACDADVASGPSTKPWVERARRDCPAGDEAFAVISGSPRGARFRP